MESEVVDVKLGDRITGKKTGGLIPSTVIGIIPFRLSGFVNVSCLRWRELYPDFEDKLIVYSEFDEPQKTMSMEDARENALYIIDKYSFKNDFITSGIYEKLAQDIYNTTPETRIVAYPIDDVEVL